MDRTGFFHAGVTQQMYGLEIGPSYRPLFPKADGWNVVVVDHADRDALVAKYQAWGVDTTAIENVDFVLKDAGIESIGLPQSFDYIAASHVIEHVPNPIGFFDAAYKLLKPGGSLRLAVPDKRYCFDLLKPVSTAGQLIQARLENRTRHTLGQIVDALMLHVARNGDILFPSLHGGDRLAFVHSPAQSYELALQAVAGGLFDIHAWVFTPTSFDLICRQLQATGLLPFRIASLVPDGRHEFLVELVADSAIVVNQSVSTDLCITLLREQAMAVQAIASVSEETTKRHN
jgi:SAM-dependent methyltransferase